MAVPAQGPRGLGERVPTQRGREAGRMCQGRLASGVAALRSDGVERGHGLAAWPHGAEAVPVVAVEDVAHRASAGSVAVDVAVLGRDARLQDNGVRKDGRATPHLGAVVQLDVSEERLEALNSCRCAHGCAARACVLRLPPPPRTRPRLALLGRLSRMIYLWRFLLSAIILLNQFRSLVIVWKDLV